MLLLLVPSAFAVAPLENGGFETGNFTGWAAWGDDTAIVGEGFEGAHAAQMSLDPTIDGFQESGMYQDVAGAAPGDHLQVTVVARALPADPVTGAGVLYLVWESWGPDEAAADGFVEVELPADGAWTYAKADFVVGAGMTDVRYVLLLDGETLGDSGTVQVDDARLGAFTEDFCPEPNDQADSDGDGLGDDCDDLCLGDNALGDADGDGICDPPEADTDGEGDTDGDDDAGCGCASVAPISGFAPMLGLLLLAARRRR